MFSVVFKQQFLVLSNSFPSIFRTVDWLVGLVFKYFPVRRRRLHFVLTRLSCDELALTKCSQDNGGSEGGVGGDVSGKRIPSL